MNDKKSNDKSDKGKKNKSIDEASKKRVLDATKTIKK
jgi:hypothetical protein